MLLEEEIQRERERVESDKLEELKRRERMKKEEKGDTRKSSSIEE